MIETSNKTNKLEEKDAKELKKEIQKLVTVLMHK